MQFQPYNENKNYIGNSKIQYKLTNWIAYYFPTINFTAYEHDIHYYTMFLELNPIKRLVMKIMYDIIFVVMGTIRLLLTINPKDLLGIPIIILLYGILLITTIPLLITRIKYRTYT